MKWIKDAWFDAAVTIVLVLAAFAHMEWAWWAIAIYTPVMLLLKVAAYSSRHSLSKFKPTDAGVPTAVYHVLYGANVVFAAYAAYDNIDQWWWIAGGWAVIWLLSAISGRGKSAKK